MWSEPVTLGGGRVIANGTLGLVSSAWKKLLSIQKRSQRPSTSCGSYCLDSDDVVTTRTLAHRAS
jgi:hypothetical protein